MSEQVTARDVEAWVAEHIMGWEWCKQHGVGIVLNPPGGATRFRKGYRGLARPKEGGVIRSDMPHYLTDANADAEVRAKVRGMRRGKRRSDILQEAEHLWYSRADTDIDNPAINELPGDWTLAAYAVGKGLDVLELERMVRGEK